MEEGIYSLLSVRSYGTELDPTPISLTMRLQDGRMEIVSESSDAKRTQSWSGVYVASDKTFARSFTCPSDHSEMLGYTATPSSLSLFLADGSVYQYGKH